MTTGRRTAKRLGSSTLAWVLGALALSVSPAPAAQTAVPGSSLPDVPREVVLRQQVLPYLLESGVWTLDKTNAPFLKEPELSKQDVSRGLLRFGKDTNNAIALLWDQPKSKLYLDLNRNLDLTDDPAGVFSSINKGPQQLFTNVTVLLKTAAGSYPVIMDVRLSSDKAGGQIQVKLFLRSLWQAKVGPPGQEWQVAALDDLDPLNGPAFAKFLLLRPWTERTNSLLYFRNAGVVPFPDQLFWLGQAFQLERRFETQDGTPVCKLEFTPQRPPLTDLRLSGESLYYAVLQATNGGYTVILREPHGALKVPQGVYAINAVWLKQGEAKAYRLAGPLFLNATAPANVVLGGPLTNSVTLTRQGRKLNMNYQLVGANGDTYRLAQPGAAKPPEFTVYHGGKKVQSGKFEFG